MKIQIHLRGPPKRITMWSLEKRKILAMRLWSVQLLVSLLLVLYNKSCHSHPHLQKHFLMKTLIKYQVYKSAEKKWRKCWKIAEIKELKENSQRHGPVETQRKENVSKTYQRGRRDMIIFLRKYAKFTRERTSFNANYDTSILKDGTNN